MDAQNRPQGIKGAVVEEFGKERLVNIRNRNTGNTGMGQRFRQSFGRTRNDAAPAAAHMDGVRRNRDPDQIRDARSQTR